MGFKMRRVRTRDFTAYFWANETPKNFCTMLTFKELRTGKKD